MNEKEPVENVLAAQILVLTRLMEADRQKENGNCPVLKSEAIRQIRESRRRLLERLMAER